MISGAIVGGIGYGVGALPALNGWDTADPSMRWLVVPALGPWIALATHERCHNDGKEVELCFDNIVDTMLVFDGLVQATGAILLTAGLTAKKDVLVRDDVAVVPRITSIGPTRFSATGLGLAVGGVL